MTAGEVISREGAGVNLREAEAGRACLHEPVRIEVGAERVAGELEGRVHP